MKSVRKTKPSPDSGKTVYASAEEAGKNARINLDIIRNTTEADIERWAREDDDPNIDEMDGPYFPNGGKIAIAIRERLGLTQAQFADRFCISIRTLQQWEQGRRMPDGPAMLLLELISEEPELVARVLSLPTEHFKQKNFPRQTPVAKS